jgi:hypothetical protein
VILLAAGASVCTPQYCTPGAAQAAYTSVLIVYAFQYREAGWDVRAMLQKTGAFVIVDLFNAHLNTPTVSELEAYHAVLVFGWGGSPDSDFANGTLLGDRLAAYHDQGGGVVVAMAGGGALRGAYGTAANGYAILDYASGSVISSSDLLGDLLEPQSPLLQGVTSFWAASRSTAPVVNGTGIVVARWRGGGQEPLVLRGERSGRTLVELNFWPVSRACIFGGTNCWTGDGAALMRNALKYSRCMPCGPGTFSTGG